MIRAVIFVLSISLCGMVAAPPEAAAQDKAHAKPREGRSNHAKKSKPAAARKSRAKKRFARNRAKRKRRRARRPRVSSAYRKMVRRWHTRAPRSVIRAWRKQDPPPLVLRRIYKPMSVELIPNPDGTFSVEQCKLAEEALANKQDGATHEVHPRLLELVYRATLRFRAPYVQVISGYREARSTSRHAQGRAMDIVLPGVSNGRLARFFRKQGFVGVGIYPRSGFVHIDVRSRSYYWRDFSLPGSAQRPKPILAEQRAKNDAQARKRGEIAVADLVEGSTPEEVPESEGDLVSLDPLVIETQE